MLVWYNAQQLTLLAVLASLASSDIVVPFGEVLLATDASEQKGAVVQAEASVPLLRALWRTRKGGCSRIFSLEEAILSKFYDKEEYDCRSGFCKCSQALA